MEKHFGITFTTWFSTFFKNYPIEASKEKSKLHESPEKVKKGHVIPKKYTLKNRTMKARVTWFAEGMGGTPIYLVVKDGATLRFIHKDHKPALEFTGIEITTSMVSSKVNFVVFDQETHSFDLYRSAVKLVESRVSNGIREGCKKNKYVDFTPSEDTLVLTFKRAHPDLPVPSPTWER